MKPSLKDFPKKRQAQGDEYFAADIDAWKRDFEAALHLKFEAWDDIALGIDTGDCDETCEALIGRIQHVIFGGKEAGTG